MLAIANANLPCGDLLCSCEVGYEDDGVIIDPTVKECTSLIVMASHSYSMKIISLHAFTTVQVNEFAKMLALATKGCRLVAVYLKKALISKNKLKQNQANGNVIVVH